VAASSEFERIRDSMQLRNSCPDISLRYESTAFRIGFLLSRVTDTGLTGIGNVACKHQLQGEKAMSCQPFDTACEATCTSTKAESVRTVVKSRQRRWLQVVVGVGVIFIGAAKFLNGLVLLTGATKYGILMEVNHGNLYYTSAVSRDDAKRLGDFLVRQEIFDGRQISTQLTKIGQTVLVRFPVKPEVEMNENYIASVHDLGVQISQQVFQGAPLEVDLCDGELKTLRAVPVAAIAK
jgi:hypothetical protein